MASAPQKYACKTLVLDAGPLLSLAPLRGLAETYVTVPQVLDELRDKRAREHFEKLALTAGIHVKIRSPDAASLAHVIQVAKKTGDYSVLSHPDLAILALTYALSEQEKRLALQASKDEPKNTVSVAKDAEPPTVPEVNTSIETSEIHPTEESSGEESDEDKVEADGDDELGEGAAGEDETIGVGSLEEVVDGAEVDAEEDLEPREPLDVELQPLKEDNPAEAGPSEAIADPSSAQPSTSSQPLPSSAPEAPSSKSIAPIYDDPSDEDDGEGEWITPSNVSIHKSRAVGLTPSASAGKGKVKKTIPVGCMTADFAMQNVLLQMNLNLVGTEGKRIDKVKTWVLRCHACFKVCKDSSKKFCPSCGNPTLLRASVTISSPGASSDAPAMQVHLKKNFQHRVRGTIYSIPSPKSGSAKTGTGEGLILREDQTEYMRAQRRSDTQRLRDEKKLLSGALKNGGEGRLNVGNWMDPDWIPEIISAGPSGKGRTKGRNGEMPVVGYGRKNPNERKHHK